MSKARLQNLWSESTGAYIIGGGPSLQTVGIDVVARSCANAREVGYKVITVNTAYQHIPCHDAVVFRDPGWYMGVHMPGMIIPGHAEQLRKDNALKVVHAGQLEEREEFVFPNPFWWTDHIEDPDVHIMYLSDHNSDEDQCLADFECSGSSAIMLACHMGCTDIFLLGFDGGRCPKGKTEWYANPWYNPLTPFYEELGSRYERTDRFVREKYPEIRITSLTRGNNPW